MGLFWRGKRQQPGQPIAASTINGPIEQAEWMSRLRGTAPIQIKSGPGGPLIGITNYKSFLAVANGNIPKRSGTAAGVGSVYIVQIQATFSAGGVMASCTLTTSSIALAVLNPSSTAMTSGNGIDSGMYCWVQQDASGFYTVTPLECS